MTSTQAVFLSFLGGAAVGAAAVFASSPSARRRVQNVVDNSRRVANRLPEALEDVRAIATDAIMEARENAKEALIEARDNAKEAITEAGNVAKQVMSTRLNGLHGA